MEPSPPVVDEVLNVHAVEGESVSVSRSCGCRLRYRITPEAAAAAITPDAVLHVIGADAGDGRLTVLLEQPSRGTPIQSVHGHRYFLHGGAAGVAREFERHVTWERLHLGRTAVRGYLAAAFHQAPEELHPRDELIYRFRVMDAGQPRLLHVGRRAIDDTSTAQLVALLERHSIADRMRTRTAGRAVLIAGPRPDDIAEEPA